MTRKLWSIALGTASAWAAMYLFAPRPSRDRPVTVGETSDMDAAVSGITLSPTVGDLRDTVEPEGSSHEVESLPRRSAGLPAPLRLAVADSLRRLMPDIERCYRQATVGDQILQRIYYLDLEVDPMGRANIARAFESNFSVEPHSDFHVPRFSESAAAEFLSCVEQSVDDLQIPSSFITNRHLSIQYQLIIFADNPPDEI